MTGTADRNNHGKLTDANLAELMAVRRELSAKQRIEMQLKEEGARTGAVMAELSAAAKKFDAQEMRDTNNKHSHRQQWPRAKRPVQPHTTHPIPR